MLLYFTRTFLYFIENPYTLFALLATLGSILAILLFKRDAIVKRRIVRAGLTAALSTPWLIGLIYLALHWSPLLLELQANMHTEHTLYGQQPVFFLHFGADVASAFLLINWFPSGVIGGLCGFGLGLLAGFKRGKRAQGSAAVRPVGFSRRALLIGVPAGLVVLALPGITRTLLGRRLGFFSSRPSPSTSLTSHATLSPLPPKLVNVVTLSPDGRRLAFGGDDGLIHVWDIPQHKQLFTCHSQYKMVQGLSWSPDGKRIASSGGPLLELWRASDGARITTYQVKAQAASGLNYTYLYPVSWSPDGKLLAAGDHFAGRLSVWRTTDGTLLYICDGICGYFSPDGSLLLTGSGPDGPLIAWVRDARTGALLYQHQAQGIPWNELDALSWSANGKRIASGAADSVQIWDARDGSHLQQYQITNLVSLLWLPGSHLFVSGDSYSAVKSWNSATGQVVRVYQAENLNDESTSGPWPVRLMASTSLLVR